MSTRAPFVPKPSLQAIMVDNGRSNSQFTPVPSNPLHQQEGQEQNMLKTNPPNEDKHGGPPSNKQRFNLASIKKISGSNSLANTASRNAFENIIRPGTADILPFNSHVNSRRNSLNIFAPSPRALTRPSSPFFPGSNSDALTCSNQSVLPVLALPSTGTTSPAFKRPALPLQLTSRFPNSDPLKYPHISAFSSSTNTSETKVPPVIDLSIDPEQVESMGPSTLSCPRSLEQIREVDEPTTQENVSTSGFGLDTPLASSGGPQRILVSHNNSLTNLDLRNSQTSFEDLPQALHMGHDSQSARTERTLRRSSSWNKRSRSDVEKDEKGNEDQNEYGGHAKKYKGTPRDVLKEFSRPQSSFSQHSRQSSPGSHPSGYHPSRSRSPDYTRQNYHNRAYNDQQGPLNPTAQEDLGFENESALNRLFGPAFALSLSVDTQMALHERETERWRNCSMGEWTEGAHELAQEFGQVLDFVKDHMTAKIKLLATLDMRIEEHKTLLTERENTLEQVQDELVRDGAGVVERRG